MDPTHPKISPIFAKEDFGTSCEFLHRKLKLKPIKHAEKFGFNNQGHTSSTAEAAASTS